MIQCSCLPLLQAGGFGREDAQPSREFHPTPSGAECGVLALRGRKNDATQERGTSGLAG
jgi:hypothetical protein